MAEILMRIVDKGTHNSLFQRQAIKAGEVVVVCRDGWPWTEAEHRNPDWRIVRVSGDERRFAMLTESEIIQSGETVYLVHTRAHYLPPHATSLQKIISGSSILHLDEPDTQKLLSEFICKTPAKVIFAG